MDRSFELHFNERPFLNHFSYLFITKTTKERSRSQSNFSILCRGNIIPKEVRDKETVSLFLEGKLPFLRIAELAEEASQAQPAGESAVTLNAILDADRAARDYVLAHAGL